MLCLYYIPIRNHNYIINNQVDILDELLPFGIPWTFRSDLMEYGNRSNTMLD